MSILDYIERIKRENESPRITAQEPRNMYAGGQLVRNTVDGSRPGYQGRNESSFMTEQANKFLKGKKKIKQSVLTKKLEEIGYVNAEEKASVFAKQKNIDLIRDVTGKRPLNLAASTKELEGLVFEFNEKVLKDFNKGNMSKTISFSEFLRDKKLKYGSETYYRSNAPKFNMINPEVKKLELAKKLVKDANDNSLKYVSFAEDIQPKLTTSKTFDTRKYKTISDTLESRADKVNKAFTHIYDNDVSLVSKTKSPSNLLRNMITDLTGVKKTELITAGLNANKNFVNNKSLIKFANSGKLFQDGVGKTLKEILDEAAYRAEGNIVWSSDLNKLSRRPNQNVFQYALRHFNQHGKNKTGESQVRFFKKNGDEIFWDNIPSDKDGIKKIKPSEVYFTFKDDLAQKQWSMKSIDNDYTSWKKGNSTPFNEVYKARDAYDKLLLKPMTHPVSGEKTNFGKLMREVYQEGFDNFTLSPYAIEHGDRVANNPFKNLRIAEQRVNQALYSISQKKGISESVRKKIFNQLSEQVYSTDIKNIPHIISGQKKLISDVLVKGKKFDKSLLSDQIEKVFKDKKIPIRQGQAGFIATDILKDIKKLGPKGLRLLSSEWVWPEIVIGWLDKQNMIQKGMSPERASSEMWKNMTLGLRDKGVTEKEILGQLGKLGYGEDDQRAVENFMRYGKIAKEIKKYENTLKSLEEGDIDVDSQEGAAQLREKIENLKKEQESVAGFYFGAIGDKDPNYGFELYDQASKELMRTEWNRSLEGRKKRIDPYAGEIGDVVQSDVFSVDAWLPQHFLGATKSKSTLAREKLAAMSDEEHLQRGIGYERVHPMYGAAMSYKQMEPLRDQMDYMYAGGGIVGIRRPSAIAPTGGPMHQGLRSLYINDRDY